MWVVCEKKALERVVQKENEVLNQRLTGHHKIELLAKQKKEHINSCCCCDANICEYPMVIAFATMIMDMCVCVRMNEPHRPEW